MLAVNILEPWKYAESLSKPLGDGNIIAHQDPCLEKLESTDIKDDSAVSQKFRTTQARYTYINSV